jgi:hypothetical protein
VNAINENLRQYVRVYSELMLEIQHMHELDCVCQFVMGIPTWAKHQLEENWPSSLFRSHHESGRLLGCGMGWKIRVQERQQVPS